MISKNHFTFEFDEKRVFVIAEAGSNWRLGSNKKDMQMAKCLIDVASQANADAIKFQTYRSDKVYVPNAGNSDYLSDAGIKDSINEIFDDNSMPYEMLPELAEYCNKKNIMFMSTPFSIEDANAIDPYVKIHKIASYEINHSRLIEFLAKSGKPVILSTGASTIDEIEWAINYFYENGGKNICLMHTIAKYPAPFETLNLKAIPSLIKKFKIPVGFSDHSRDPVIAPLTAISLGATIIEKHFTLSNSLPGPDHSFALTPNELVTMIDSIRNCEKSFGDGEKIVQEEEKELRNFAQRGIQAIKSIHKDDILKEGVNIDILRPGKKRKGLHPKFLSKIEGKKATKDIPLGDGISDDDYN